MTLSSVISVLALIFLRLTPVNGSVTYYIKPNETDICHTEQPCFTLSEFAAIQNNNSDISLVMVPGNHKLVTNISFSNITSLRVYSEDVNTMIKCEPSSHFSFESIEQVSIEKVNFIGCGNSFIGNVEKFIIQDTIFKGLPGTGTSLIMVDSNTEIVNCSFLDNQFGTIMESVESLKLIATKIFWLYVRNITGIVRVGGVLIANHSNISISCSRFENNTSEIGGDIFADEDNTISIFNSTFVGSRPQPVSEESPLGGAIFLYRSTLSVMECLFHKKHATFGASVMSSLSNITINGSTFDSNSATDHSAGLFADNSSSFIYNSIFHNNTAGSGAGIATHQGKIVVAGCNFTLNKAYHHGAALDLYKDTSIIRGCRFEENIAHSFAGAVLVWSSTSKLYGKVSEEEGVQACMEKCSDYQRAMGLYDPLDSSLGDISHFISNSALSGAALYVIKSTIKGCGPIIFSKNVATVQSNVFLRDSDWQFQGYIDITQNLGSIYAFNSNINFTGCAKFTKGSSNNSEAGALTLFQAKLTLKGEAIFEYNLAEIGGAIMATKSEIDLSNNVYVVNNSASISGGGLYLDQSELFVPEDSSLTISRNSATKEGGGIHAISSFIKSIVTGSQKADSEGNVTEEYKGALLNFTENSAQNGGAIYLEYNSKIVILKDYIFSINMTYALNFIGNSAQYGGAIYVSDDASDSGSCASNPFEVISSLSAECFISVVSSQVLVSTHTNFHLRNVYFDQNTATVSGATLFGGLLDRCIVSPFNEVSSTFDPISNEFLTYEGNGLQYLMDISTENKIQSISSFPIKVCICENNHQNCGYKTSRYVQIKKGHNFNVSVIAVDQVFKPARATIRAHLNSTRSNLLTGQLTEISNKCTNVTFQIISSLPSEELTLFASDGRCKDAELSKQKISVIFLPCTCPIGFTPTDTFDGVTCLCTCDSQIKPYVTECNNAAQSFRKIINIWVSYVNRSNTSGWVIHKYCPFDYCNISAHVNLNQPNGVDTQCAFNRTGMLCGACKPGLSLSLGSSKCLKCPSYWPALFVIITVFAVLGGIGLVILFLWLNITVAVGTLNGLLFYANILAANRVVLLPYPEPNFITIFISWLNLELGIDVCYINGMDIYIKTWLQFVFPLYIIFLVVLLIIISRYSTRFSKLISKRNPVATLATLILISYGRLFHIVLLAQPFSYSVLTYPDGEAIFLWLPDGTVRYFDRKHIFLVIVALLILAYCIAYSFLLLCWQLLLHIPDWKIFRCIKKPSLYLFMEAYHAPYKPRHRYWTGLLLLARAIIYLVATSNVSGDPQIQLIAVISVLSCIILLKMFIASTIFKKWLIDSIESFFYFNIIILASFTAYNLSTGNNQDGIAYTSVVLSIIVTFFILFYHLFTYTSIFEGFRNSKFAKSTD